MSKEFSLDVDFQKILLFEKIKFIVDFGLLFVCSYFNFFIGVYASQFTVECEYYTVKK
jgi:hypothetical protein